MSVPVLFVDDEEDIRFSFEAHFARKFPVHLAANGVDALRVLEREADIGVAVTDLRMPEMDGLQLIREARAMRPELGFIVVSGHGGAEQIIEALRLGARNYMRKPYDLPKLQEAILHEARRYLILLEERRKREREKYAEQFLTEVNGISYILPSDLELVNPIAFRLAENMQIIGKCEESDRSSLALALIEIIVNAIEHGNLGITGEEKVALKTKGEQAYQEEISRRRRDSKCKDRKVKISATITREQAVIDIEDEGEGFDYLNTPDPTDLENLLLPSGRGILLARSIMDELIYLERGNHVRMIKQWISSKE
ncbi:MAG: ATP-binding protein [SAR324 cluster bacterium]|nr:ATP-binding protein [SAR324 cluster bacterium]